MVANVVQVQHLYDSHNHGIKMHGFQELPLLKGLLGNFLPLKEIGS